MFTDEILDNWDEQPFDQAMSIAGLGTGEYRAWTIKKSNTHVGVAVPLSYPEHLMERFSTAYIEDGNLHSADGESFRCMQLWATCGSDEQRRAFAAICAELVDPGPDGVSRKKVSEDPLSWWIAWKELLGNSDRNERIYDVVAELSVLDYLAERNEKAVWNGPSRSTYDIDCGTRFVEVKSTSARKKREVTLSNRFQLIPPEGRPLYLILCQMEAAVEGRCIDSLVDTLVDRGYDRADLNAKIALNGFEEGMSARRKCFIIHTMSEYTIDDSFPAIRDDSFVGGKMPAFVKDITYTIDLDGVEYKALLADGDTADAV